MLDIQLIRTNPSVVVAGLKKKLFDVDFTEFLTWDEECRSLMSEAENLRSRRNKVSAEIPMLKKKGEDVSALLEEMKGTGDKIKSLEERKNELEAKIQSFLASLPNLPADDVVPGGKENNKVIRTIGKKPEFSFKTKDHVELATSLGLIDYERGTKLGGNGFWVYTERRMNFRFYHELFIAKYIA